MHRHEPEEGAQHSGNAADPNSVTHGRIPVASCCLPLGGIDDELYLAVRARDVNTSANGKQLQTG
jgi:hypothetical protein